MRARFCLFFCKMSFKIGLTFSRRNKVIFLGFSTSWLDAGLPCAPTWRGGSPPFDVIGWGRLPAPLNGRPPPHPPRISLATLTGRARDRSGVVRFFGGAGAAGASWESFRLAERAQNLQRFLNFFPENAKAFLDLQTGRESS